MGARVHVGREGERRGKETEVPASGLAGPVAVLAAVAMGHTVHVSHIIIHEQATFEKT